MENIFRRFGIDMGNDAFENMTADLLAMDARVERRNSILQAEYDAWRNEFVFDGIRGLRYGQSFCNHFDITDYVLFYMLDWDRADQHIRTVYLEKC